MNAGGSCEAAVTVRIRCGWVKFRVCYELLYGRRLTSKAESDCLSELCMASCMEVNLGA